MKNKFNFLLLLYFLSLNANLFAQNFWVPDANFRARIKLICPNCLTPQDSLITTSSDVTNLFDMDISNSSISSLSGITYFMNLSSLDCSSNQLSSLPFLPNMSNLKCSNNLLTNLPPLPVFLTDLDCSNNQLISLPVLSDSLTKLNCNSNQLTSLPLLPQDLWLLKCTNNHLSSLPALPSLLLYLDCSYNFLTNLPALSIGLDFIDCSHNQLTSLPKIPNFVTNLILANNPIICFPELSPRFPGTLGWVTIAIDSTLITCIPNTGLFPLSVVQSQVILPFCSPSNTRCFSNFTSGYIYWDLNGNGIKDSFDTGFSLPINYSSVYSSWADSTGLFNAISDTGLITFQLVVPPYYTSTTPTTQSTQVNSGNIDTLYFGLQPLALNINDLTVDVTPMTFLRVGFKTKYLLHYQNRGTSTISNVEIKFIKPDSLFYLSSFPLQNSISGDTLIWNISSLQPFHQGNIFITDSVSAASALGDSANAYAWIKPLAGDTTPLNNRDTSIRIIRGAYDPNDKSVSPEVVLPNSTGYLEYTIRFQNTGTDTAFAVMVTDTLSTLLDASSLQMISASHAYDVWVENGVVKWNFINILLPDSNINELESHGFVKFKIKPLPGLTVTDSIQNKAVIYFDYNAAVTTNTIVVNVLNTTQVKDLKEMELQIFPNPVQESIRIVNQHAGALGKVELLDMKGNVLETKTISTSTYTWNLQHLPAGTYILKGQGWGQKVVKD